MAVTSDDDETQDCQNAVLTPQDSSPRQQQQQQQQEYASRGTAPPALPVSSGPLLDLSATARRFGALAAVLAATGAALLVVPEQFFHAVMRQAPSGLEMLFARMVGVAMVYKAALAHILKGAAEADRLGATTAQRIMLGFLLRGISNLMAFRQIASCWAAFQYPVVLFLFPSLLLFSFGVNLLAFEPYNPFFLAKLLFPVGVGLLLGLLIPQPAAAGPAGFHADAPTWLKTGVLAGALPSKMASRAAGVAKVGVKAANKIAPRWMRTQIINKSYAIAMPKEAGPGLAKTITRKMDFMLPTSRLGWAYFLIMLAHLVAMFHTVSPQALFLGAMTPLAKVLKMTWSAGFLIAAFCCDALKTAADRNSMYLQSDIQLNLCLALFELGFAVCLVHGIAGGLVQPERGLTRVASSVVCAVFFAVQCSNARRQAEEFGHPQQPAVATVDYQEAQEEAMSSNLLASAAASALAAITIMA